MVCLTAKYLFFKTSLEMVLDIFLQFQICQLYFHLRTVAMLETDSSE